MGTRNKTLKVRVTEKEYDTIMQNCIKSGRTVSELLRECACGKEIIVLDGLEELLTELRRQGNNLNQLTILARQERISFVGFEPFEEVYRQAWQA
ncbi:plasmid mobilization protein [Hungatella hathewayi]|uniref:plasmid mobilization protein n=1 Tax=Hungatella hathewayi TaxID=154046 RepID=UPI003567F28B